MEIVRYVGVVKITDYLPFILGGTIPCEVPKSGCNGRARKKIFIV